MMIEEFIEEFMQGLRDSGFCMVDDDSTEYVDINVEELRFYLRKMLTDLRIK